MRNAGEWGALRERMQGTALTALTLLLLGLVFAFLVPRREEIASTFEAARQRAEANARMVTDGLRTDEPPLRSLTEAPSDPAPAPEPAPSGSSATAAPATETASLPMPENAPPADAASARHMELLARPVALDTATLLVGRGKVKLAGIEAVPLSRRCGEGSGAWFCGAEARSHFRAWLRARSVNCDVPKDFGTSFDEIAASCDLAGEDIGRWLVSNGWAAAQPEGPYGEAESRAKSARLGIWADRRPAE